MEIKAHLNYLHIAPRKVRLVAEVIKGMPIERAELELRNLPKRSALPVLKLLKSAVANAMHNFQLAGSGLVIKSIIVNPGNVQKRFTPRAFGRASPIRKRTSHVSVILETPQEAKAIKTRGAEPLIREAKREDFGKEFSSKSRIEKTAETAKGKKQPGFIKKVFTRKVI